MERSCLVRLRNFVKGQIDYFLVILINSFVNLPQHAMQRITFPVQGNGILYINPRKILNHRE